MAAELVCLTKTVKASSTDGSFVLWVPCPPHSAHLRGTGWAILAEVARCLAHFGCEMCFSFHHLLSPFPFITPRFFLLLPSCFFFKTIWKNKNVSTKSLNLGNLHPHERLKYKRLELHEHTKQGDPDKVHHMMMATGVMLRGHRRADSDTIL